MDKKEYIERDGFIDRLKFKRDNGANRGDKYPGLESAIAQAHKYPAADVAPRSVVAKEIFSAIRELYGLFDDEDEIFIGSLREDLAALEKEYVEGVSREPNTIWTLDDLSAYLCSKGWSVTEGKYDWTIGWLPPSGAEFAVRIRHDNDVKKAVDELKSFTEFFSVEEHLEAWSVVRPQGLRPQGDSKVLSKRELVEDAQAIMGKLGELVSGLSLCEQKSVDETLAEAVGRVSAAEISGKGQEDRVL